MVNNIFCIECGFELPSTAKFCKKCGVEIDAVEAPAEVEPKIKQDKQPSTQPVTETPTQKIFSMGGGFLQLIIIFICGGVGGVIGGFFGSIGVAVVTIVGLISGKIMAKGILGLIFPDSYYIAKYHDQEEEEKEDEEETSSTLADIFPHIKDEVKIEDEAKIRETDIFPFGKTIIFVVVPLIFILVVLVVAF